MDKNIPILERIGGRANASSADPLAGGAVLPTQRAGRLLIHLRLSIRDKILLALLMVVFLMSVPYVFTSLEKMPAWISPKGLIRKRLSGPGSRNVMWL